MATTTTQRPARYRSGGRGDAEDDAEADAGDEEPVDDEGDEDGEAIKVDDFDDIPGECRDAFAEFLQAIEPSVERGRLGDGHDGRLRGVQRRNSDDQCRAFDDEMDAAGCDDYEVGENEESIQAMIDFAEDEAPGTVGYLEFLRLHGRLHAVAVAPRAADVPTDCEGAIAYMEDLIAETPR